MVQGKINRGRHTDHPAGRHSIQTKQCPPPPSPHFLQAGCPSCRPTNSVKALKATSAFELGRRCLSSPQWCYLHRLRILLMDSISGISYRNKKLVLTAIKPVMHANFIFQQDSTLAHCVCHLIKLLQGKISNFLPPELWPQNHS